MFDDHKEGPIRILQARLDRMRKNKQDFAEHRAAIVRDAAELDQRDRDLDVAIGQMMHAINTLRGSIPHVD